MHAEKVVMGSLSNENEARELSSHSSPSLDEAWFDEPPLSERLQRRSSTPPPPSVKVGEFLGDELADSWLR
jgi:hypothetical protein